VIVIVFNTAETCHCAVAEFLCQLQGDSELKRSLRRLMRCSDTSELRQLRGVSGKWQPWIGSSNLCEGCTNLAEFQPHASCVAASLHHSCAVLLPLHPVTGSNCFFWKQAIFSLFEKDNVCVLPSNNFRSWRQ